MSTRSRRGTLYKPIENSTTPRSQAESFLFLLDVNLLVLGTLVHDHLDDYAAAALGTFAGRVNFVALDQSPFPARPPVAIELVVRVHGVLLRVLLPGGIGHVEGIGGFIVLLLQRGEKLLDQTLLRPIAELIHQKTHEQQRADDSYNELLSPASSCLVVFL